MFEIQKQSSLYKDQDDLIPGNSKSGGSTAPGPVVFRSDRSIFFRTGSLYWIELFFTSFECFQLKTIGVI